MRGDGGLLRILCRFPWSSPRPGLRLCVSFAQGRDDSLPECGAAFWAASPGHPGKQKRREALGASCGSPCTDETARGAPREEDAKNRRPAVPNWLSEAVAFRWSSMAMEWHRRELRSGRPSLGAVRSTEGWILARGTECLRLQINDDARPTTLSFTITANKDKAGHRRPGPIYQSKDRQKDGGDQSMQHAGVYAL